MVGRGGSITDVNTSLPMSGPFMRKIILGLCTGSEAISDRPGRAVRMLSNRDFGAFLARVFAR